MRNTTSDHACDTLWNPRPATFPELRQVLSWHTFAVVERKRISRLFIDQMAFAYRHRLPDLHGAMDGVAALEGVGQPTGMKPAKRLEGRILKGLWHSHYGAARFIAQNLLNEMNRKKARASSRIKTIIVDESTSALQKAKLVAHEFVPVLYSERSARGALTGEWIVYAVDDAGRNHYLAIARHPRSDDEEQHLLRLIVARCEERFLDVLKRAQTAF